MDGKEDKLLQNKEYLHLNVDDYDDDPFVKDIDGLIQAISAVLPHKEEKVISPGLKLSLDALGTVKEKLAIHKQIYMKATDPAFKEQGLAQEVFNKALQTYKDSCRTVLYDHTNDIMAAPSKYNRVKAYIVKIVEKWFGKKIEFLNVEASDFKKAALGSDEKVKDPESKAQNVHSRFFAARDYQREQNKKEKSQVQDKKHEGLSQGEQSSVKDETNESDTPGFGPSSQ